MKRVLITGEKAYIGCALEAHLRQRPEKFQVARLNLRDESWRNCRFCDFDAVVHTAGLAHKKEKATGREPYFAVNRDLTLEVAKAARAAGVKQFVFFSTMAVYGEQGRLGAPLVIRRDTPEHPVSWYAQSKLEAEGGLRLLAGPQFQVAILRPPMVYGKGCKGNYAKLEAFAKKSPVFPQINNQRSMVNIAALCQAVQGMLQKGQGGLFFPQDDRYYCTSQLVREIRENCGKPIWLCPGFSWLFCGLLQRAPAIKKVFGNLCYDQALSKG